MPPKISIIGAGNVGAECAYRCAQLELGEIVLLDIVEGLPQGKALDMMQAGSVEGYNAQIKGVNDYADIKGSEVVVMTAGLARKPGMSRDDLLHKNAEIVSGVIKKIKEFAPRSIILMVSNPLDAMTYLAYKVSGFESKRVLGMAPLLDLARMQQFIAEELKIKRSEVKAYVLGSHGDLMVPLPRLSKAQGKPLTELLSKDKMETIVRRTKEGGAEIVKLLKTGSAYYAPGTAAAYMAESIVKDKKVEIISCVYLSGEYGLSDVYVGVPAVLGKGGVEKINDLKLTPEELRSFKVSAEAVRKLCGKLKL